MGGGRRERCHGNWFPVALAARREGRIGRGRRDRQRPTDLWRGAGSTVRGPDTTVTQHWCPHVCYMLRCKYQAHAAHTQLTHVTGTFTSAFHTKVDSHQQTETRTRHTQRHKDRPHRECIGSSDSGWYRFTSHTGIPQHHMHAHARIQHRAPNIGRYHKDPFRPSGT